MRKLIAVVALFVVLPALGQSFDKAPVRKQGNVVETEAVLTFETDAGCSFTVRGEGRYDAGTAIDGGVLPADQLASERFPFNGARCTAAGNAVEKALDRAWHIGDGGVP